MDPLLTPDLALAYLRELSLDVLAVVVLDADGRHLAGERKLSAPGRALLEVAEVEGGLALRTRAGWVFGARGPHAGVVAATGPLSLPGLVLHDVLVTASLLGGAHAVVSRVSPRQCSAAELQALGEAVGAALGHVGPRSSVDS